MRGSDANRHEDDLAEAGRSEGRSYRWRSQGVEQSAIGYLNEGQKISYEVESGRNGKSSAVALKTQ